MQLIKYRFIQMSRDKTIMFWSIAWPIILVTFFQIAFGNMGNESTGDSDWSDIPVAYIQEDDNESSEAFEAFLDEMNGDLITLHAYDSSKEAEKALINDDITGIFYGREEPSLTVGKSGLNQSILSSLLETYNKNAHIVMEVVAEHPERLSSVMEEMNDYSDFTEDKSLGGNTLDPMISYFFALIAYACLSGSFLGVRSSFDSQANLSPLAARRSITPTHKLKLVLTDFLVLFVLHFINMLVLTAYMIFVLKVDLGSNIPALLLIEFMGSVIGVSIGILIGNIAKLDLNVKTGINVAFTLIPSFLAGLMIGDMKYIIEKNVPIINRINPAAVLSDAVYYLGVFNDTTRMFRCLVTLAVMSILFLALAFLGVRREQYDSI